MSIFILQNMSSNLFMLCHYSSTIVHDTNNSITYICRNTVFLNDIKGMSFDDTKKVICGRLELNYNDTEIDITWRCLVGEHQYFSIPIACDVDFRNMMEMFVQGRTNMIELYMSSQPKLSSSYNVKHEDTNISILISARPLNNYHIHLVLVHLGY